MIAFLEIIIKPILSVTPCQEISTVAKLRSANNVGFN